jgi:hypothetical protein
VGKSRIVTTQWPQLHISQCAAWGPGVDARLLKGLNDRLKAAGYAIRDGVEIPSDLIVTMRLCPRFLARLRINSSSGYVAKCESP